MNTQRCACGSDALVTSGEVVPHPATRLYYDVGQCRACGRWWLWDLRELVETTRADIERAIAETVERWRGVDDG